MPTISEKTVKSGRKGSKNAQSRGKAEPAGLRAAVFMILSGAVLGLSAPGIGQWYLAWVGVAPLLIGIATSRGVKDAFVRGLSFGFAYNLVYQNWYLGLQPLDWLGFNAWQGWLLAIFAWLYIGLHQGVITGIFAGLCRIVPITGGFLPKKTEKAFALPALITVPLLWVIVHNLVCNAHDALGVPWSMLEYSQYRQQYVIQCASLIGGIGLGFLILLCNTALAALVCAVAFKKSAQMLAVPNKEHGLYQMLGSAALINLIFAAGLYSQSQFAIAETVDVSVIQANINIDMQRTAHRYTIAELMERYRKTIAQVPRGICVFAENALPAYLRLRPNTMQDLAAIAREKRLSMVIGAMDQDEDGHPYNAAYGIDEMGKPVNDIYHKRYLVPFGEYTPWLINYFPEWIKRLTNTPAGGGFTAGRWPVVLDLGNGRVGPLICFETLSPELVASTVRHGGQLLVNISDLAWFHNSIIGDQMVAFSVFRAVENRRDFIFAANSGPSAIIDSNGHIRQISHRGEAQLLSGRVGFNTKLTPFTRWFVF